jgi:hypothetical protein
MCLSVGAASLRQTAGLLTEAVDSFTCHVSNNRLRLLFALFEVSLCNQGLIRMQGS